MDAFPDDHARHHRPPRPRAAPKPKPKRICVSRSVATAGLVGAAMVGLMVGGASGVVFSPDQRIAESSPALDEAAIRRIAGEIVDQAILVYHIHDHGLEESSPSPSASPSPSPGPTQPSATAGTRATSAPSSTRRPSTPTRTAPPAPTAAPSLCLRPGKPSVGQDPCKWPHN